MLGFCLWFYPWPYSYYYSASTDRQPTQRMYRRLSQDGAGPRSGMFVLHINAPYCASTSLRKLQIVRQSDE